MNSTSIDSNDWILSVRIQVDFLQSHLEWTVLRNTAQSHSHFPTYRLHSCISLLRQIAFLQPLSPIYWPLSIVISSSTAWVQEDLVSSVWIPSNTLSTEVLLLPTDPSLWDRAAWNWLGLARISLSYWWSGEARVTLDKQAVGVTGSI